MASVERCARFPQREARGRIDASAQSATGNVVAAVLALRRVMALVEPPHGRDDRTASFYADLEDIYERIEALNVREFVAITACSCGSDSPVRTLTGRNTTRTEPIRRQRELRAIYIRNSGWRNQDRGALVVFGMCEQRDAHGIRFLRRCRSRARSRLLSVG